MLRITNFRLLFYRYLLRNVAFSWTLSTLVREWFLCERILVADTFLHGVALV